MKLKHLIVTILIAAAFTLSASAQTEGIPATTLAQNNQSLPSTTQAALSSDTSSDAVEPVATPTKTTRAVAFHHDGLWFSTHDGSTNLHVHGYVQADNRMFSSNTHGEEVDAFLFRRIRPLFEGTLFNNLDFRFMPDFGQSNSQIQEAFLELKTLPWAKLRVGKFKEPVGLEVLRQDRELTFVERSLASDLIPLRYIGAQISGTVFSNSIDYAGGYFDGSSDGSNGIFTQWAHSNEAAARAFFHPFATTGVSAIRQFGLGLAGSAGAQHGTIAGLKTIGQSTLFKYSSKAVANGEHNRLSPQAYYYVGPFGAMGEYVLSSQDVLNKGITQRMRNQAWQAAASVVLTGEKNTYAGVHPRNSFEPNRGLRHFGAFEIAGRISEVRIDGEAFPLFASSSTPVKAAKEHAVGFNWYLNNYVKLQTDYVHTGFATALVKKSTPLQSENLLLSQIQLAF